MRRVGALVRIALPEKPPPWPPLRVGLPSPRFAGEGYEQSLSPEFPLQLDLGALQPIAFRLRQIPARAIDIEGQHRHRRAIGARLAARAPLRRALQRGRDLLCAGLLEHAASEVKGVALAGDAR